MDRTTILWALVLFFGATIAFRAVQRLTEDSPLAVTLALELVVLAVIVAGVVVVVRRRR
jgi:hypothetical protein